MNRRFVILGVLVFSTVGSTSLVSGCTKDPPITHATSPGPSSTTPSPSTSSTMSDASASPKALTREEAKELLKNACLACHSEEMMAQQRLTLAQWTKVVTKMVTWGAKLDASEVSSLSTWLAASYGSDAGPYEPSMLPVAAAAAELAPLPDGAFAGGDAERGRALYTDQCSECHGADARGKLGVVLVDRPFLYRASEVAETIRHGRGRMAPIAMKDAEIADVLAHLRRLKR